MIESKSKYLLQVLTVLCLLVPSLSPSNSLIFVTSQSDEYWPNGDWRTSSPEYQNMDPKKIQEMKEYVEKQDVGLKSFLMIKNGYLIEETYYDGSRKDISNPIYSVTKSVLSTLMGIAIQEGYIESVHKQVLSYFPNYSFANMDNAKRNITIFHLLTMTTGLEWDEWWVSYSSKENDLTAVKSKPDWIQYILDKPMVAEPGTIFNYNTGASHLLSAIITRATGNSTEDFANNYLFGPLGIENYYWLKDSQNITRGGEGLSLNSIDMAKLGYLYLSDGFWNGPSILAQEWIINATKAIYNFDHQYNYGYSWWLTKGAPVRIYFAWGWAGQRIYVMPTIDLIVVFTSFEMNYNIHLFLLYQYILPARGYTPTPASSSTSTSSIPPSNSTTHTTAEISIYPSTILFLDLSAVILITRIIPGRKKNK